MSISSANQRMGRAFARIILIAVCTLSFVAAANEAVAQIPEVNLNRKVAGRNLPPELSRAVPKATERGVHYLRRTQNADGTFGDPTPGKGSMRLRFPVAHAALPGLALLENKVSSDDIAVQNAATLVRNLAPMCQNTYDIGCAILFLGRLGLHADKKLIRTLCLRLMAGQSSLGGWRYTCPILNTETEKKLEEAMSERKHPLDVGASLKYDAKSAKSDAADNSNTQFAILGLWAGRKHAPTSYPLGLAELRFRSIQNRYGWNYTFSGQKGSGSMTCVGIMALAIGRSTSLSALDLPDSGRPNDVGIEAALLALGEHMALPLDPGSFGAKGPKTFNPYFLWSIERAAVACELDTIGGRDWYRWGVDQLLPLQNQDGSWVGYGNGGLPAIDTSMALLFLKRADVLPDLRKELAKRVKIVDPGPPELKAGIAKEGKVDPKKAIPKPKDAKTPSSAEQGPPSASLGKVQLGQATELPLKVRGPEAFRIVKVEGTDGQVKVDFDKKSREVHELAVTVKAAEPGELRRTLTLVTDLPDLREVEIRVVVRVEAKGP
ncbi:MAG: hypothetical protein K2X38_24085 [Gemmataceae bacterium]|nr:hypothetical protein [Gemmataceae bacterium]